METRAYLQQWATRYRDDLTTNIMPFWLENGLDKKHGGVFTCLNRDGSLMDTTKSVWFQGRFAYVCAFAYNTVEKRQEYLDAARSAIDFSAHCKFLTIHCASSTPLDTLRLSSNQRFNCKAIALS